MTCWVVLQSQIGILIRKKKWEKLLSRNSQSLVPNFSFVPGLIPFSNFLDNLTLNKYISGQYLVISHLSFSVSVLRSNGKSQISGDKEIKAELTTKVRRTMERIHTFALPH